MIEYKSNRKLTLCMDFEEAIEFVFILFALLMPLLSFFCRFLMAPQTLFFAKVVLQKGEAARFQLDGIFVGIRRKNGNFLHHFLQLLVQWNILNSIWKKGRRPLFTLLLFSPLFPFHLHTQWWYLIIIFFI